MTAESRIKFPPPAPVSPTDPAPEVFGAQLARVELQEALRGLVTQLPGLALAVPLADLRFKPGMAIHNLRALPITWTET
jgi:hypothetical protein